MKPFVHNKIVKFVIKNILNKINVNNVKKGFICLKMNVCNNVQKKAFRRTFIVKLS